MGGMQTLVENPEYKLQEIELIAQRKYPGRGWDELSPEEHNAVFSSYERQRDMGSSLVAGDQDMMGGANKEVGPYNVYVKNPWESLAGGVVSGVGCEMQRNPNNSGKSGRDALADLQSNSDAVGTNTPAPLKKCKRLEWLSTILKNGLRKTW